SIGIIGFLLSPVAGRVARGGRARVSFAVSAVVGIAAALLTALSATTWDSFPLFVLSQIVLAVSMAFMLTSLPTLVIEGSASKNTSEATGIQTVIQTAFSGVGTSVSSAILAVFAVQLTADFHPSSETGYIVTFSVTAVLTAIALIASFALRKPAQTGDEAGRLAGAESFATGH
ncbi:MAG: hypothetical protein QM607_08585, partial [Microbacterium sp.]